jgi:hypothetical protein
VFLIEAEALNWRPAVTRFGIESLMPTVHWDGAAEENAAASRKAMTATSTLNTRMEPV